MPIEKVKPVKGKTPPVELLCPDKTTIPLVSWVDIVAGVARWLVDRKYLNESHCPVPIGAKNALFNRWPVHQNGREFDASRKVGQFFVNVLMAPAYVPRRAVNLINAAGQEPSDFMVRFEDSRQKFQSSRGTKQYQTKRRSRA